MMQMAAYCSQSYMCMEEHCWGRSDKYDNDEVASMWKTATERIENEPDNGKNKREWEFYKGTDSCICVKTDTQKANREIWKKNWETFNTYLQMKKTAKVMSTTENNMTNTLPTELVDSIMKHTEPQLNLIPFPPTPAQSNLDYLIELGQKGEEALEREKQEALNPVTEEENETDEE